MIAGQKKSDANFPVNQDTVDSAVKGVAYVRLSIDRCTATYV
mgnify:CR=1 FL=1